MNCIVLLALPCVAWCTPAVWTQQESKLAADGKPTDSMAVPVEGVSEQVIWTSGIDGYDTCGNPCPVIDRNTGDIVLLSTHNPGNYKESEKSVGTRTLWVMRSTDDGLTWSQPREITTSVKEDSWDWYATGPGIGIQLTQSKYADRLVIPANHTPLSNSNDESSPPARGSSHTIFSDDGGRTWTCGEPAGERTNESQIVELADGRLLLNMRAYFGDSRRRVSISDDGGNTWTAPEPVEELIEPVCQGSILRYSWPDEERRSLILFANPSHRSSRQNLVIHGSADEGRTWPITKVIEHGYAAYCCLIRLDDGRIGCLYEGSKVDQPYRTIIFATLDVSEIEQNDVVVRDSQAEMDPPLDEHDSTGRGVVH